MSLISPSQQQIFVFFLQATLSMLLLLKESILVLSTSEEQETLSLSI